MRARIGGYVVDMVIFAAIAMIVTVISGFILLATTRWGEDDPSDPQFYTFLAIIGFGVPLVWSVLNIALLAWRGQTGGQYVAGVGIARDDGVRAGALTATAWWFCFNPLFFSWPMAFVAGLPLTAVAAVGVSSLSIFVFGVIFVICAAAPLIALASAAIDGQNRALHDRIIGVVAVPAG
jgi:hypothetical protein